MESGDGGHAASAPWKGEQVVPAGIQAPQVEMEDAGETPDQPAEGLLSAEIPGSLDGEPGPAGDSGPGSPLHQGIQLSVGRADQGRLHPGPVQGFQEIGQGHLRPSQVVRIHDIHHLEGLHEAGP